MTAQHESCVQTGINEDTAVSGQAMRQARHLVLRQFSKRLAHDLRNSLTVIRNVVGFLQETVPPGPGIAESLEMIDAEVNEINLFTTKLTDITHGWQFDPHEEDLESMLSDVISKIDGQRHLSWKFQLQGPPITVWCDRPRFQRVLRELFQNSIAAMAARGEVSVAAWQEQGATVIDVKDCGTGVPPEVQSDAFEPFVTTKPSGLGLGLPYCREILKRHGGTVELAESSPAGSVFRISLPKHPTSSEG